MTSETIVLLHSNPMETHKPAEGIRIALGLSTSLYLSAILVIGESLLLLTEKSSEVIDADILERYLPAMKESGIPFIVPEGSTTTFSLEPEFLVEEVSYQEMLFRICQAGTVLIF